MTGGDALPQEVFALAYHLKWSPEAILGLAVGDRRRYLELLREQLEQEARAVDEGTA